MSDSIRNRVLFRDFKPADFPSILKLWELNNMAGPERGDTELTILNCNKQGGKFIILEIPDENKIIGTSWLTWDGRRIFLHHFCIHPDYQGKGLGELLARKSLEFIRKKGAQVKLEVHKKNIPAKRLYEKLGFIVFEAYDIYMKRDL